MEPTVSYTPWRSAVHACCVAVQAMRGIEQGLQFSETWLDLGPEDGECSAFTVGALLAGEGLDAMTGYFPPDEMRRRIERAASERRICLFEIADPARGVPARWAIVQAMNATSVAFAVALGFEDEQDIGRWHMDCATGWLAILTEPLGPRPRARAHIINPS